jgi:hypothetical protein
MYSFSSRCTIRIVDVSATIPRSMADTLHVMSWRISLRTLMLRTVTKPSTGLAVSMTASSFTLTTSLRRQTCVPSPTTENVLDLQTTKSRTTRQKPASLIPERAFLFYDVHRLNLFMSHDSRMRIKERRWRYRVGHRATAQQDCLYPLGENRTTVSSSSYIMSVTDQNATTFP